MSRIKEKPAANRLYGDLAWLWPMWGDVQGEYARYAGNVARLIDKYAQRPAKSLLNITCGGGKNMYNLKRRFAVTGLDSSPAMLEQAEKLNPECEFVRADMRSFSLGKTFDAILFDDGVSYLTSRGELAAAFRAAYEHLNAGGVMVVTPDVTTETFTQNLTSVEQAAERAKPEGVDVVFVENVYDPDPADEQYEATFIYLIRRNGALRIETDLHTLGIFPLATWRRTLAEAGFQAHEEKYDEEGNEYVCFACIKAPA